MSEDPRTAESDRRVAEARAMLARHAAERARIAQERLDRAAEARAYEEHCKEVNEAHAGASGHSHHRRGRVR